MQTSDTTLRESAIWTRLLASVDTLLSPEAAQAILKIEFPKSDKDRMRELADKARRGALSPLDQEEIDTYGRIGSFLSILQSKARVARRGTQGGNGVRS